jgi:hypothetical protein
MLSNEIIQQVEHEIASALTARKDGFEGRARVIARRAVAIAITSWMEGKLGNRQSVLSILTEFQSLDIPEDIQLATSHLLQRVNAQHCLDEGIDLLVDARTILAYCQSTDYFSTTEKNVD